MKPFLLCSLALILPASARIGETKEELITRYGKPLMEVENTIGFKKGDIVLLATLWEGKCHSLVFTGKTTEDMKAAPFPPEKVQELLEGNAGSSKWKGEPPLYKTEDGKITAILAAPGILMIRTTAYQAKTTAEAAGKANDSGAR